MKNYIKVLIFGFTVFNSMSLYSDIVANNTPSAITDVLLLGLWFYLFMKKPNKVE